MPPPNDDIANATALNADGSQHTVSFDNTGATYQGAEQVTIIDGAQPSIWAVMDLSGFTGQALLTTTARQVSGSILPYGDIYRIIPGNVFVPAAPDWTFITPQFASTWIGDGNANVGRQQFLLDPANSEGGIFYIWLGDWNYTEFGGWDLTYQITEFVPAAGVLPAIPSHRWALVDLDGSIITLLDKHVFSRSIDYRLDVSTRISGRVRSNDPLINTLHTDGFPKLAEGDRLLYDFRRDYGEPSSSPEPWFPRAAGVILQLNDVAGPNGAETEFVAYDPWQILYRRPMVNPNDPTLGNSDYTYNRPIDEIIIDLLDNMALFSSPTQPGVSAFAFLDWGQTGFFTGTIESLPTVEKTFQKETYIGACLDELCQLGSVDIWMEPIWDPVNRPGYTHQLNVYAIQGDQKPAAIFGWDKPLHSTTGVNRDIDGTERANNIRFHLGQGGPSAPSTIKTEGASIARFGEYWDTQFWVAEEHDETLSAYAEEKIQQVSEHGKTVSVDVTPLRCPDPFTEWFLGDTVRVFASKALRATQSGFQRVVAFTLDISDNALETVRSLEIYIPQETDDDEGGGGEPDEGPPELLTITTPP